VFYKKVVKLLLVCYLKGNTTLIIFVIKILKKEINIRGFSTIATSTIKILLALNSTIPTYKEKTKNLYVSMLPLRQHFFD
jgi:hypothetical protein